VDPVCHVYSEVFEFVEEAVVLEGVFFEVDDAFVDVVCDDRVLGECVGCDAVEVVDLLTVDVCGCWNGWFACCHFLDVAG